MPALLAKFATVKTHINYGLLLAIGFSIPISNALTNILLVLLLVSFVAGKEWSLCWSCVRNNHIAMLALALFSVVLLGIVYSPTSLSVSFDMVVKYRELLLIPLFMVFFQQTGSQHQGLYAFIIAMLLTLLCSLLMNLGWESLGKGTADNPFVFKNHITQGILMALAAYFLFTQAWFNSRWRWLGFALAGFASVNLLLMTEGRSGYLVFACLVLLLVYQIWRLRGLAVVSLMGLCLGGLLLASSVTLQQRVHNVMQDIQDYEAGLRANSNSLRYDFLRNGLRLAAEAPVLGHGTGSFAQTYRDYVLNHTDHHHFSDNPHNEYLMIAIQWGGVGLLLWLSLLLFMWRATTHYSSLLWRWQAQGLMVTIVVGSLVNSLLLDTTEGHLLAYLAALFFSVPSDITAPEQI